MEKEDEGESGWTEFNSIDTAALLYYYIYYYYYTNYDYDYMTVLRGQWLEEKELNCIRSWFPQGDEGVNLWVDGERPGRHLWLHV